jgi:hypothetical protein
MKFKSIETFDTNGEYHSTDGPARIFENGNKSWHLNGRLHRTDGPAIIHDDGTKVWARHGELHRTDGPAIMRDDGTKEWWLLGAYYLYGERPPKKYLEKLKELGIEFDRGSDES